MQRTRAAQSTPADPYRIASRFVIKHRAHFARALAEIRAGRKESCWSWFIFPVAPWVVNGVERGSCTNMEYALRDLPPNDQVAWDAARAYLAFPVAGGVNLRQNFVDIMAAVGDQLQRGVPAVRLVGGLDDPKMRSSLKLFERVARGGHDDEVHAVCARALALLKEEPYS